MKTFKLITSTVCMMVMAFILPSCSDDSDEPDYDSSDDVLTGLLSPDILPGTWILQSFTDESGTTTTINKEFTILSFTPKLSDYTFVSEIGNYEYWAESYDELINASSVYFLETTSGIIGFCKMAGSSLTDVMVTKIVTVIPDDDWNYAVSLTDFTYKDGVLTCENSSCLLQATTLTVGTVKLKKVS